MLHAPQNEFEPRMLSRRSPVLGRRGSIASSQPLASSAGLAALERGGSAADAAVAAAAVLAVTEPTSTGIGGDCFALYYDAATRQVSALNGSGRAPEGLTLERVVRDGFSKRLPALHAHTITVPGACAGWHDLLQRHGRRSLSDALQTAIQLAEEGFPVAPWTAHDWQIGAQNQLTQNRAGQELLVAGRAPRAGDIFRNPGLARSLRIVAENGPPGFYEGEIADAIVSTVRAHGGTLSMNDLAQHRSTWDEPISIAYRDVRVWECPPSGQGLVVLLALKLLADFDLAALDPLGAQRIHLQIEALRLAFADAFAYVADPAFSKVPIAQLLSDEYTRTRSRELSHVTANPRARAGTLPGGSDTVYLCAVDSEGNACSFINSNYQGFGTGLVPRGCGFSLQNRGAGFSLDPEHPNVLAPRKRPYHTIIPGMITRESDSSLFAPFGVMGGYMQPQGQLQVVTGLIDDGIDPQAVLERPRFCLLDGDPQGSVAIEPEISSPTRATLRARGHLIQERSGWERALFGRGQIIRRDSSGVLWGGSDPRADGCAVTF